MFLFTQELSDIEERMTAGSVSVPTIVPLRAPVPGLPKTSVDTDTRIELNSGVHLIPYFVVA